MYNLICILSVAPQKATPRIYFGNLWVFLSHCSAEKKHNQILPSLLVENSRDNICFYKQYFHLKIAAVIKTLGVLSDQNSVQIYLSARRGNSGAYFIDKSVSSGRSPEKSLVPFPGPFFFCAGFIF